MAAPARRKRASAPASVAGPSAAAAPTARAATPPRRLTGRPAVRLPAPVPRPKSGAAKPPAAEGPAGKTVDPRLKRSLDKVKRNAASLKKHAPASEKAAEAQSAAVSPPNERTAGAQAGKVEEMQSAEVKKPEANSFLELLRQEIEKALPKNVEQTDDYLNEEDTKKLKGSLTSNIDAQKQAATTGLKSATESKPDPATIPPKSVTPLPTDALPAPTLEAVGARDAMPTPKPEEEVSLQHSKDEVNQQFADNKITPTQLTKANDPRFTAVLTAKGAVEQHADKAPAQYRAGEQKTLTQAVSRAVAAERKDMGAMTGAHARGGAQVKSRQQLAKERDEARRKEVADQIEKIFGETKKAVEEKLATLEADVSKMFDEGLDKALKDMKEFIETRKDKWKDDRYGGIVFNFALWGYDKLRGIDEIPAIKQIYVDGNKKFTDDLDSLVVKIADLVESRLKDAKDEVARGEKRIHDYVEGLPKDLQEVGRAAEKEVSSRFDELRQSIDDKKNDLAQSLAQRYKEAHDKADEAIKALQAEDKGLVSAFLDKLAEVIEILRNFRRRVMALLKKAEDTIDLIVADPIGFLKNLLAAIKKGLGQFVDRIWEHLEEGFMEWLLGSLAEMGITLPRDFSLPSILQLVLDVLGFTYAKIRGKVARIVGERNLAMLEAAWELVKTLLAGGPAALWEKIKEYLGNLKEMVIGAIQDWLVTTIIKSAVTKLATMFNPVGAIIQAIMLIYNTVMFFVERINQILAFVESIINSAYKIATGAIGEAADWIEKALARTIPLIIGFLARLLGLSGLTEKIKGFILKVQTKVDHAIDKVIEKIVGGIKNLVGFGKAAVGKLAEWWNQKKEFTTEEGHRHTLFFKGSGNSIALVMASGVAASVEERIAARLSKRPAPTKEQKEKLKEASRVVQTINSLMTTKSGDYKQETKSVGDKIGAQLDSLAKLLVEGDVDPGGLPLTKVIWKQDGQRAGLVVAEPLTELAGNTKGSTPREDPEGWDHVRDIDNVLLNEEKGIWGARFWRRMHLLNHNLHGPGVRWNLTPGRQVDNTAMSEGVEETVKGELPKPPSVYYYEAKAEYYKGDILQDFPKKITIEWGTMKPKGKGWERDKKKGRPVFEPHPPPLDKAAARKLDLKTAGRSVLESKRYAVARGLTAHIQAERGEHGPFKNATDFKRRMSKRYQALTPPVDFMKVHWPQLQALIDKGLATI